MERRDKFQFILSTHSLGFLTMEVLAHLSWPYSLHQCPPAPWDSYPTSYLTSDFSLDFLWVQQFFFFFFFSAFIFQNDLYLHWTCISFWHFLFAFLYSYPYCINSKTQLSLISFSILPPPFSYHHLQPLVPKMLFIEIQLAGNSLRLQWRLKKALGERGFGNVGWAEDDTKKEEWEDQV